MGVVNKSFGALMERMLERFRISRAAPDLKNSRQEIERNAAAHLATHLVRRVFVVAR
jgi:hypothetical protein